MRASRLAAAVAFGVAVVGHVRAQDVDDPDIEEETLTVEQLHALHKMFDLDGDGRVSLKEVMQFSHGVNKAIASRDIGAILEEIDTSKDGRLTLEEHLTDIHNQADGGDEEEMKELEVRKKVEAAKFKAADVNGDGVLDSEELPALFYPELHDGVLDVTVKETMRQKDRDGDGKLMAKEFWEADDEVDDGELTPEEKDDFAKLDHDHDGFLNLAELRAWESGRFHTEEAMRKMIELADKDSDMHITASELAAAREELSISEAQYHLIEWAEHHEL
mmetsp:Transcript_466/g.922  ORF Transcript_466/g.922 Transcript_466/m.922 type:complete len:275 (+) Transcript_466:73-897(+)